MTMPKRRRLISMKYLFSAVTVTLVVSTVFGVFMITELLGRKD